MNSKKPNLLTKLKWNLPWLARYPFVREKSLLEKGASGQKHIIFTVADHFEPSWSANGLLDIDSQRRHLDRIS